MHAAWGRPLLRSSCVCRLAPRRHDRAGPGQRPPRAAEQRGQAGRAGRAAADEPQPPPARPVGYSPQPACAANRNLAPAGSLGVDSVFYACTYHPIQAHGAPFYAIVQKQCCALLGIGFFLSPSQRISTRERKPAYGVERGIK